MPGSPPRVRGKVRHPQYTTSRGGITPACAGKSLSTRWTSLPYRDHPRVCGEKSYTVAFVILYAGSPPRVRGKVMAFSSSDSAFRITPACAGKRIQNEAEPRKWTDHPRVCGEKMFSISGDVKYPGSPPRVRGKARVETAGKPAPGITPACAGKSSACKYSAPLVRDHPRVCGEKRRDTLDYYYPQGSPPRVRGKASS